MQFELPSRRDVKKCVVTKETVERGVKPTLVTEAPGRGPTSRPPSRPDAGEPGRSARPSDGAADVEPASVPSRERRRIGTASRGASDGDCLIALAGAAVGRARRRAACAPRASRTTRPLGASSPRRRRSARAPASSSSRAADADDGRRPRSSVRAGADAISSTSRGDAIGAVTSRRDLGTWRVGADPGCTSNAVGARVGELPAPSRRSTATSGPHGTDSATSCRHQPRRPARRRGRGGPAPAPLAAASFARARSALVLTHSAASGPYEQTFDRRPARARRAACVAPELRHRVRCPALTVQ